MTVNATCPICERKGPHTLDTFVDKDDTVLHLGIGCECGRYKVDQPSHPPPKGANEDPTRYGKRLEKWKKSGGRFSNVLQRFKVA